MVTGSKPFEWILLVLQKDQLCREFSFPFRNYIKVPYGKGIFNYIIVASLIANGNDQKTDSSLFNNGDPESPPLPLYIFRKCEIQGQ